MIPLTKKGSAAAVLAEQCRICYLPIPTHYGDAKSELKFHPTRRWRFDVSWTDLLHTQSVISADGNMRALSTRWRGPKLALEIDGGVFSKEPGRHNRGAGYRDDLEKLSEAIILGWYVLRCLPEQIHNGQTVQVLERFFLAHHVLLPNAPPTHRRLTP